MNLPQRWVLVSSLCIIAIGLSLYSLELRSMLWSGPDPTTAPENDISGSDGVVAIPYYGATYSQDASKGLLFTIHSWKEMTKAGEVQMVFGLYASHDLETNTAAFAGAFLPAALIAAAIFLALGSRRT